MTLNKTQILALVMLLVQFVGAGILATGAAYNVGVLLVIGAVFTAVSLIYNCLRFAKLMAGN